MKDKRNIRESAASVRDDAADSPTLRRCLRCGASTAQVPLDSRPVPKDCLQWQEFATVAGEGRSTASRPAPTHPLRQRAYVLISTQTRETDSALRAMTCVIRCERTSLLT